MNLWYNYQGMVEMKRFYTHPNEGSKKEKMKYETRKLKKIIFDIKSRGNSNYRVEFRAIHVGFF